MLAQDKDDEETVEERALIARIESKAAIEDECEELDVSLSEDEIKVIDQVQNRCSKLSCSPLQPVLKHLEDLRKESSYDPFLELEHITDEEIAERCQHLARRPSESSPDYYQRLMKAAIAKLYGRHLCD